MLWSCLLIIVYIVATMFADKRLFLVVIFNKDDAIFVTADSYPTNNSYMTGVSNDSFNVADSVILV